MDKAPKFIKQVAVAAATAFATLTTPLENAQAQAKSEGSQPAMSGLENLSKETMQSLDTFGVQIIKSGESILFLTDNLRYLGSQQLLPNLQSKSSSLSSFSLLPGDRMEARTKHNSFLGRDILEITIQKKDSTFQFHKFTTR